MAINFKSLFKIGIIGYTSIALLTVLLDIFEKKFSQQFFHIFAYPFIILRLFLWISNIDFPHILCNKINKIQDLIFVNL